MCNAGVHATQRVPQSVTAIQLAAAGACACVIVSRGEVELRGGEGGGEEGVAAGVVVGFDAPFVAMHCV
eukprot:353932-Chlamydomonas_euryale.AAC.5